MRELLLTLLSALAQAESENKSSNIQWGIKRSVMYPDCEEGIGVLVST